MSEEIIANGPNKNFESIKKVDENEVEYWTARELMVSLGYSKWSNFEEVINKAKKACLNSTQVINDHFTDIGKMVEVGSNTVRKIVAELLSHSKDKEFFLSIIGEIK